MTLYAPRRVSKTEWSCGYSINGLKNRVVDDVRGADAMQSLILALEAIRLELDGTRCSFSGGGDEDTGFPRFVPMYFGPEFSSRINKLIDKQVERFSRAAEARYRRRHRRQNGARQPRPTAKT